MDETVKRQLARIKALYLQASIIARREDEVSLIIQVQLLDFIVESFLKITIRSFRPPDKYEPPENGYYNKISALNSRRPDKDPGFKTAWDEVVGRLRDSQNKITIRDLPLRRQMLSLHELRNGIQHDLRIPHPINAAENLALVRAFLEEGFREIYEEDFDTISLLDIITDQEIKNRLLLAYGALANGDHEKAIEQSAISLYILFSYISTAALGSKFPPFFQIKNTLSNAFFDFKMIEKDIQIGQTGPQVLTDLIAGITDNITELRTQLASLSFGLDYGAYLNIKPILPTVHLLANREYQVTQKAEYNSLNANIIIEFVEAQAIRVFTSGFNTPR